MRTVGRRKERPIVFSASADLLVEGARFNDEIHRLPTGDQTFIRKGIYRFRSDEASGREELASIAAGMAIIAKQRS
ncbi:MAG: hypothetical protein IPJ52_13615 [Rhodocyclaceae bacterium]|jgi:hypothetical protein|nr:hypothetical protein [Rhodocyclaceae bacterium]